MLAQHVRVHAARRHACFFRQGAAQPSAVEEGAGAEDAGFGEVGVLLGEVGDYVDGVGDEQEDGVGAEGLHVAEGGLEDGFVFADEVGAGFALSNIVSM